MTEELKPLPCPFCNSGAELSWATVALCYVGCSNCGTEGPDVFLEKRFQNYQKHIDEAASRAVQLWNTRSPAWRDIESAPKDGTRLLFFDGVQIKVGHWLDRSYTEKRTVSETQDRIVLEKVHISDGDWYIDDYEIAPTHWQPLPPPPEEGK